MGDDALLGALVRGHGSAIEIDGVRLAPEELVGAATAVADRVTGASMAAVEALPCAGTVVAVVGCLIAGVPVVPVPADAGSDERAHLLADSRAEVLLVPDGKSGEANAPEGVVGPLARASRRDAAGTAGPETVPVSLTARSSTSHPEPVPGTPGLVLYTSGTTGAPKGVVLSRRAIAAGLDAVAEAWDWTPDDVLVHGLPLFHVHGLVLGVLGALRGGSRLVHTGRPRPERYAAAAGSLYFGVPTVWSRVVEDPVSARALRGARLLVSGSAPLPALTHARLRELTGHGPVERYGMTETLITLSARAAGPWRPGWVGTPVRGVVTRSLDEQGAPVARDGESLGELWVHGPMLFDRYLNRPEATAAVRDDEGWVRTGDVVAVDADGTHRIVGRVSTDLIKSGGFRIGAGEVEDALRAHPGVRDAAVVGWPDDDLGQRVVAFVIAEGVRPDVLADFVSTRLARHKRPRAVFLVDDLPRNALGKVRKTLLGPPTAAPAR